MRLLKLNSNSYNRSDDMATSDRAVARLALVLEYHGGNYHGFQSQKNVPTIQDELETAIRSFSGEVVRVRGASRTDAGVHAKGQVVDFISKSCFSENTWIRGLNYYLPWDIKVQKLAKVPDMFHSRRNALSRTYRYNVLNREIQSPLLQKDSGWIRHSLDETAMGKASSILVGEHNFSAFCSQLPQGRSPVRKIMHWEVWREGDMVLFEVKANAFLPHQILRTGGVLVDIGKGVVPVATIKKMLEGSIIKAKSFTALPSRGLCLEKVEYDKSPFGES